MSQTASENPIYEFTHLELGKEEFLALIRKTESQTARLKQKEIDLELKRKLREFVSIEIVQKELDLFLVELKTQLESLPLKFAQRFASVTDESEIQKSMEIESRRILDKMSSFYPSTKPKLSS